MYIGIAKVTLTIQGPIKLGVTCLNIICKLLFPVARAASTNSFSRKDRAIPRAIRAMFRQAVIPIPIKIKNNPPKALSIALNVAAKVPGVVTAKVDLNRTIIKIINNKVGKPYIISTKRIITLSIFPP
ncbi:hypothetical protein ES708_25626 [subsurface metagenome]